MNARQIIAALAKSAHENDTLLAALALEGLSSLRALVESECVFEPNPSDVPVTSFRDGWWDTGAILDGMGGTIKLPDAERTYIDAAVSLLDRAGEIERKPGEPHLIRFIEQED